MNIMNLGERAHERKSRGPRWTRGLRNDNAGSHSSLNNRQARFEIKAYRSLELSRRARRNAVRVDQEISGTDDSRVERRAEVHGPKLRPGAFTSRKAGDLRCGRPVEIKPGQTSAGLGLPVEILETIKADLLAV